ncbi:class I SAM-dependent methyltransferase [Sphingomonas sp. CJ99]
MSRAEVGTGRKAKRQPVDWYVDESWVAWQLTDALGGFAEERASFELIWDPCAGSGRTMCAFLEQGHRVAMSDLVDRLDRPMLAESANIGSAPVPMFFKADFLEGDGGRNRWPGCSIVCNPPYSYIENIAEAFVRQALRVASRRVCMVLPLKWLASQGRYRLFMEDHPPQSVMVLTQRPSMPPGDMIDLMGRRAFNGGTIDYAWFVWDVSRPTAPGSTRILWLPPLNRSDARHAIPALAGHGEATDARA